MQGGGDTAKIDTFKYHSAAKDNRACLTCHKTDATIRHWSSGVHAANNVRCIDCHQIHPGTLKKKEAGRNGFNTAPDAAINADLVSPETKVFVESRAQINADCLRCHKNVQAQMSMPYHHPLREGKMSCVDCHNPHGGPNGNNLKTANVNELCLTCHAQYRGPFAYQHPPVTESCLNCHDPHGSANTNLLTLSQPALCLQCHSGHHNGANLPLTERCTNCHSSIHGTDVATPSGGSRFIDKGPVGVPSEPPQTSQSLLAGSNALVAGLNAHTVKSGTHSGTYALAAATAPFAAAPSLLASSVPAAMLGGHNGPTGADPTGSWSSWSLSPSYRIVDGSGFLGRVGEYDSLQQSAGVNSRVAYVSPQNHLTLVWRGVVLTGSDYSIRSQLAAGNWLNAGLDVRSLVQQQDHYPSYMALLSPSDFGLPGAVTDSIPANATFSITRRLAKGHANIKLPNLPVHLFIKGNMQARVGQSQLIWLDENSTPAVYVDGVNTTCGDMCHQDSHFQPVNYTTRNVTGGANVKLKRFLQLSLEHSFSSFNDRLTFPTVTYTGPFTPETEGISTVNPPPSGPAPTSFPAGRYYLDIPSPSQYSADRVRLSLTPNEQFQWNGFVGYTRVHNTFTHNQQNWFDADQTATWNPNRKMQFVADYHQHNLINAFKPYYTMYGNVSYHRNWEGFQAAFTLPLNFSLQAHYRHSGITRSNAFLWPQVYSMDNTDLQMVIPSSSSNNAGIAVRYHQGGFWNARLAYDWTGTHHPGFLIVPGSNNKVSASLWITPKPWFTFSNQTFVIIQNAFPSPLLPYTPNQSPDFGEDISGLPLRAQRHERFYTDAASATFHPVTAWNLGLGYSYQQNNLKSYMAFQNDASVNFVLDQANVPWKALTQAWWANSTYTIKQHLGLDLAMTYNASSSGFRPDLNPNDAASMGNASLIRQSAFDAPTFQQALGNLYLSSTTISGVKVPQWIGRSKVWYQLPYKFEGGMLFYYGSYSDHWRPNLNGDLRTFDLYIGRTW